MNEFDQKYRARFEKLSTTNVADAEDALGIRGATYGIRPLRESWGKVVGRAVTIKVAAAGETKNTHHLGMTAISVAEPGDIIIINDQNLCIRSAEISPLLFSQFIPLMNIVADRRRIHDFLF